MKKRFGVVFLGGMMAALVLAGCSSPLVSGKAAESAGATDAASRAVLSAKIHYAHYDTGGSSLINDHFNGVIRVTGDSIALQHTATVHYRTYVNFDNPGSWTATVATPFYSQSGSDYYKWDVNLGNSVFQVDYYVDFTNGVTVADGSASSYYTLSNGLSYTWYLGSAAVVVAQSPGAYSDSYIYGSSKLDAVGSWQIITKKPDANIDTVTLHYSASYALASGGASVATTGTLPATVTSTLVNPRPTGNGALNVYTQSSSIALTSLGGDVTGKVGFYIVLDRNMGNGLIASYLDNNWGNYYRFDF